MTTNAAQYCRMSTESQNYSIENQKKAIAKYAEEHGFEVVRSYEDPGVSGLSIQRRRGLKRLLQDVLENNSPFRVILVYDVSRWGRFQDVDEAAHYEFLCRSAGVQVIYCAEQFTNDGSFTSDLMKAIKRTMAGEYSRELSVKVSAGQRLMVARGFWMHSRAPYGMRRMLLSPSGKHKGVLERGDHKLKSDRVTLVPGPNTEIAVVRKIFRSFLKRHGSDEFSRIANELNKLGLKYSTGRDWTRNEVRRVLTNPAYAGINVWGRRTKLLSGRIVENSHPTWTTCLNAFSSIISRQTFEKTQEVLAHWWRRRTDAELLAGLKELYRKHGKITRKLMLNSRIGGPSTYSARFGSLINAYRLVGYEAPKRYVETVEHTRSTWAEEQSLANSICSIFPSRVTLLRRKECEAPILLLDTGTTVTIRTCRSYTLQTGRKQWKASIWQRRFDADLVLLALYDSVNSHLSTFYLTFKSCIPPGFYKFRKEHPVVKNAVRLKDLFRFYETALTLLSKPR